MHVIRKKAVVCLFMNILIENEESLEYLTGDNQWTKNAAQGKCFKTTGVAFDIAKKEPIGKFNIVAYISQTKQFVNLDHGRGKGIAETEPVLENVPLVPVGAQV
jgi:hypothetical protein